MNKPSFYISVGLTLLLFYYVISIYQWSVPGTSKWLISGRIQRAAADLIAAQQAAQTPNQQ